MFVCDHRFKQGPDGGIYTPGYYPYSVWERYLAVWDEVTILASVEHVSAAEVQRLNLSSGPRVQFAFYPRISANFLRADDRRLRADLPGLLSEHHSCIARLPATFASLAIRQAQSMGTRVGAEVVSHVFDGISAEEKIISKVYAFYEYFRMRRDIRPLKNVLYVTDGFLQDKYPTIGNRYSASNVNLKEVVGEDASTICSRMNPGRPVIGMIGGFQKKYKGHHFLVAAVEKLKREQGLSVQLQLVGEGDSSRTAALVRELSLESEVEIVGGLSGGDAVNRWLDTLDLYVQPSLQEGLPRALIEAMGRGLPSLGFITGGIPELLTPDALIKVGDVDALARAMHRGVTDRSWREKAAAHSLSRSSRYLARNIQIERERFYRGIYTS
ncbi:glycosyltransferase family 4 protein [Solimonas sp. K1W22B-7]|uniref:glycosyltransferase family 4 protein n=1 Tax=Solimonas sp. K1W22B-7 TaxID=2303331 RepID=UPI0013C47C38|nr:glycosyltransferase [Solimonas sp. K1W22B-7]